MSAAPPFDRTDLPQHTRVIGAPVAAAYGVVADVGRWPAWIPNLLDPVIAKDGDRFLLRARRAGRIEHHEGSVILRGPTHTFGVQFGDDRLWFRTRPNPSGTKVDVVLDRPGPRSLRGRFGRGRRRAREQQWVVAILDGLTRHVGEAG